MTSVALVNASGRLDGITFGSRPILEALQDLGFSVTWYQCVDRGVDPFLPPGARTVPGSNFPWRGVAMGLNRLWTFPRGLREVRSDIVLLSDPTLVRIARDHPTTVVKVHDLRPLSPYADRTTTRWMFRYAMPHLRRVPRILVTTETMARTLGSWGVAPHRVRVVPDTHSLGLHPEHVPTSVERVSSTGKVRVLCVSTDRPYKNLELYLRLIQAMQKRAPPERFEFTLVSTLREPTRLRVAALGPGALRVIDSVDDMTSVYAEADVLVHPSLYEGFGRQIVEAMAFGLPVLAVGTPTVAEVLGGAGFLLDAGTLDPWVDALLSLADTDRLSRVATRSLERGRDFLPERFQAALEEALRGLP
jgi:glycosyltransferase involved in cell wall biosynthesis